MSLSSKEIALIIWWCEGTKPRRDKRWKNAYLYPVEVINSDYRIVKIFIDFLVEELKVPINRIKGQIQLHEGDDVDNIEEYWSQKTSIPRKQFNKTIIRPKGNKPGKNNGTFKVRLYDKSIFIKLSKLLEENLNILGY